MATNRQRWTETRRRPRDPDLYEEWLKEERVAQRQARQPLQETPTTTTTLQPQQHDYSPSPSPATIRTVTPDELGRSDASTAAESPVPERGTDSFERAFLPYTVGGQPVTFGTTTTITGGRAAHAASASGAPLSSSPPPAGGLGASKSRRLARERVELEARRQYTTSAGSSNRNGNGAVQAATSSSSSSSGMLVRSGSRNHGHTVAPVRDAGAASAASGTAVRPRTRTLEETRRRERSPGAVWRTRNRIGSVNSPSSPIYHGAEYLASVPAAVSPPSPPSISSITSLGSPAQDTSDTVEQRSISPVSSRTVDSSASGLPADRAAARRMEHLMKTLKGGMSGNLAFRRHEGSNWTNLYCFVAQESGSMMYESRSGGSDAPHRTLVSDLRGCTVLPTNEHETPLLEVSLPHNAIKFHVKLSTQADFDAWYATFLHWSLKNASSDTLSSQGNGPLSPTGSITSFSARPELPPRTTSNRTSTRDRASSNKSDRRKSSVSVLKEAPVIKIGKMIFWDTNIGYSSQSPATGTAAAGRPQAYRMQSQSSRRWRRISGQLRENGELKLQSDADNSLISVVQLSQLSRCAIQRLDPSVLENDFCIAIYPQYTSSLTNNHPSFVRPIFLSLENRVLFEVWFVLLRAFTIPQLYGPPSEPAESEGMLDQEAAHMASTKDMFRVERSLSIRMVEAKMFPPANNSTTPEPGFAGGRSGAHAHVRPEQYGYYAEVLLDNETRGKTTVKFDGLTPLWGESFDFVDLPPVLSSASVVIKRRPPDSAHARESYESRLVHEAYGFTSDQHGGYTGLTFDVVCGKVEVTLQELEEEKEVEKWWPVMNMYDQRVGDVLIKAKAEEGVILMAHDYQPLSDLLHRFSNALTLQIAQLLSGELKRLSDCLLNIFQVSGKAGDWLMALIEEEIDGITKETPLNRARYQRRAGSNDTEGAHFGSHSERELLVRDMNKNATVEANLLFRGNTLCTKSLDTHMRRVGKEYLEESLAAKLREINERDPDCEVDPNRVPDQHVLDRNWRRLLSLTQEVWRAIMAAKSKCPVELRLIFRHIRACAEDRYGDFLRTVSYSSVSGFLFLRFFCPAVLNPKLFGLLKDDIKPRSRRTFTLIAKSLQTLANMASFGTKEHWMEPMNVFLSQHRESFKSFIDDICYIPTPTPTAGFPGPASAGPSPTYPTPLPSSETHLSYGTPMTIMQRLPPTSREGFPSLPYLIDQARAFADLVQLWLEVTAPSSDGSASASRRHSDIVQAIQASEGDLVAFHDICSSLNARTLECLNRAERQERPPSGTSFPWEDVLGQLHQTNQNGAESSDEVPTSKATFDTVAETIASDPSILPPGMQGRDTVLPRQRNWGAVSEGDDEGDESEDDVRATQVYDPVPPPNHRTTSFELDRKKHRKHRMQGRPNSASVSSSTRSNLRRALASRGSDRESPSASASASASVSNVSSAVSSDTEPTALPNYEREKRHRERREAAVQQIQQQMEEARIRDDEKERERSGKRRTPLSALGRIRREKERERGS